MEWLKFWDLLMARKRQRALPRCQTQRLGGRWDSRFIFSQKLTTINWQLVSGMRNTHCLRWLNPFYAKAWSRTISICFRFWIFNVHFKFRYKRGCDHLVPSSTFSKSHFLNCHQPLIEVWSWFREMEKNKQTKKGFHVGFVTLVKRLRCNSAAMKVYSLAHARI